MNNKEFEQDVARLHSVTFYYITIGDLTTIGLLTERGELDDRLMMAHATD